MKVRALIFAATMGLALSHAVYADDAHHKKTDAKAATGAALTEGEIRKVDKDTKKITIKHAPIKSLDMPAMTMVFQVKDATMLDQVVAGDKIKFDVEKVNGAFTIQRIEKQ